MKLAVVGGGAAGLAAAWALRRLHSIRVYERSAAAGGHACTIALPGRPPVDLGFQFYHPGLNPNLAAALRVLAVPTVPLEFSISALRGDVAWTNNGRATAVGREVADECARFSAEADAILAYGARVTLRQMLDERGYSPLFRRMCLAPILHFWWASRGGLFDIPAAVAAMFFRGGAISLLHPTCWQTVAGGVGRYVERLCAAIPELRPGVGVTRIERDHDGVRVYDDAGGRERFDHIVLAVDAATALALLAAPSPEEQALLGGVEFDRSDVVLHRDARVMPADRGLWSYGNYIDAGLDGGADDRELAGIMTYYAAHQGHAPVFVSVGQGLEIAEEQVLARRSWQHMRVDAGAVDRAFPTIQGRLRTWFCGGHTVGFPIHEHAFCSGLAVAEALGAEYPFADDPAAWHSYELYKTMVV